MNYTIRDNIIYSINFSNIKSKTVKIAGFDLDHTLIKPKKTIYPKSVDDFELVFPNVAYYLNNLIIDNYTIIIFSNQSSLNENIKKKNIILGRIDTLFDMVRKPRFNVIISLKKDNYRKPNTGMWDFIEEKLKKNNLKLDKHNSFYVGDAAGRIRLNNKKKDFACSDRMFALNIKINFYTPEAYFLGKDDRDIPINFKCENKSLELFDFSKTNKDKFEKTIEKIKKFNIIILIDIISGKSTFVDKFKDYIIINQDILKQK